MAAIVVPPAQIAVLSPQAIVVAFACGPIPGFDGVLQRTHDGIYFQQFNMNRIQSEHLLNGQPSGTFVVRVSSDPVANRFVMSQVTNAGIRHFTIPDLSGLLRSLDYIHDPADPNYATCTQCWVNGHGFLARGVVFPAAVHFHQHAIPVVAAPAALAVAGVLNIASLNALAVEALPEGGSVNEVRDLLTQAQCPICMMNFKNVSFGCGHAFCARCTEYQIGHGNTCSICVQQIQDPRRIF